MYSYMYNNGQDYEEADSTVEDFCSGPAVPFDSRNWYLHEKFHQMREGRYPNVLFHASRRYPDAMTVTMEHVCPITCFLDDRSQDDETVTMTCHVASLTVANYASPPPEGDIVISHAEYIERLQAVFECKKTEIQQEVAKVKEERSANVENMNISLRVITVRSALMDRRNVTATYLRGLVTRDIDRVEEIVGRLFDECVNYLTVEINQYCQQEPQSSFTLVI